MTITRSPVTVAPARSVRPAGHRDDADDPRRGGQAGLGQRATAERLWYAGRDIELEHLNLTVEEEICLAGARAPTTRDTALAVSNSLETMKSTSRSPARQVSRYAMSAVRITVRALEKRLTSIAVTRLASSRAVQASTRSA